jgi:hypothetical protein
MSHSFRKNLTKVLILLLILVGSALSVSSQTIENIRVEKNGDKILIRYDLIHDNPSEKFLIRVYSSANNFSDQLIMIKGDAGDRITPGKDKLIEWYARSELGSYQGDVIVEVRLFESKTSFYILSPYSQSSVKRASELQINWSGGLPNDKLEIDLYLDGKRLRSIGSGVENSGDYRYVLPENLKPSSKYQIKIENSDDPNTNAYSGNFGIKRKLPLGAKIIPGVVVAGVVGYLLSQTEKPKEDLPLPLDPN